MKHTEYEDGRLAINRLYNANIITDPDYWLGVYRNLAWLEQLLINLSRLSYDLENNNFPEGLSVSVRIAITYLSEAKAINSIEYWTDNYGAVANLGSLLIKAANYVVASDTTVQANAALPRLTIAGANNGVDYIDDETGFKDEFGIVEDFVIWDDVNFASILLAKGREWLANQRLYNSVSISALDLSLVNESYESFTVGNYYRAKNDLLGIDITYQLIEQKIDIVSPSESTLTFGDRPVTLSQMTGTKG